MYKKLGQPLFLRGRIASFELCRPWRVMEPGFRPLEDWIGVRGGVGEDGTGHLRLALHRRHPRKMSRASELLRSKEPELVERLTARLRETAFDNRYFLHPRRFSELGAELCVPFPGALRWGSTADPVARGRQLASEGVGEKTILGLVSAFRRFAREQLGAQARDAAADSAHRRFDGPPGPRLHEGPRGAAAQGPGAAPPRALRGPGEPEPGAPGQEPRNRHLDQWHHPGGPGRER